MTVEKGQPHEPDLYRTDQLPILEGVEIGEDVEDDAVRMEYSPVVHSVRPEFPRAAGVDLPSLAESVRSVEERIARQSAEFEALNRSYEKSREAEVAAVSHANVLASEIAGVRALLESEQTRLGAAEKALIQRNELLDAARVRIEEALKEAGRHQSEALTLRDQLAARDATIVQVTHSLGERDAQFAALQREHGQMVPVFEERTRVGAQLTTDLQAERKRTADLSELLKAAQQSAASLDVKLKKGEEDLNSARRELNLIKTQATSYLDQLRTREWRRGFDENLHRELDGKIAAAHVERDAMRLERDQLRQRAVELEREVKLRDEDIAKWRTDSMGDQEVQQRLEAELARIEEARIALVQKVDAVDDERVRLDRELSNRQHKISTLESAVAQRDTALISQAQSMRHMESARAEAAEKAASLEGECGRLNQELGARTQEIESLKAAAATTEETRSQREMLLHQVERACADLSGRISALENERDRMHEELLRREAAVAGAQAAAQEEAARGKDLQAAADKAHAELAQQIEGLKADLRRRDGEMAALAAQLKEARGPIEPIEAEVKRLNAEVASRAAGIEQLNEENRSLRAALERTRGALEEREFLIRRLERSETNNAHVLGRIQTSIERLGSVPPPNAGSVAAAVECVAEFVRIDGSYNTTYALTRRTRIGRATGCEMHIESSSVSRHHALVLTSSRDVIIEDLNSTNGVLVNGRKVSRQLLHDGDIVAIGEAQFRLTIKFASGALEHSSSGPQAPQ